MSHKYNFFFNLPQKLSVFMQNTGKNFPSMFKRKRKQTFKVQSDPTQFSMNQCSGSVTFWYGSGSVDPYLRITVRYIYIYTGIFSGKKIGF